MFFREVRRNATWMEVVVSQKFPGTAWAVFLAALSTWPRPMTSSTVMTSLSDFYIRCRHTTAPARPATTYFDVRMNNSVALAEDDMTVCAAAAVLQLLSTKTCSGDERCLRVGDGAIRTIDQLPNACGATLPQTFDCWTFLQPQNDRQTILGTFLRLKLCSFLSLAQGRICTFTGWRSILQSPLTACIYSWIVARFWGEKK